LFQYSLFQEGPGRRTGTSASRLYICIIYCYIICTSLGFMSGTDWAAQSETESERMGGRMTSCSPWPSGACWPSSWQCHWTARYRIGELSLVLSSEPPTRLPIRNGHNANR